MDFIDGAMMVIDVFDEIGKATLYIMSIPYNKLYKVEEQSSSEVETNGNTNPETRI